MELKKLQIELITVTAIAPTKAYSNDLGWDLYADEDVDIPCQETKLISTGIRIRFPNNIGAMIKDRSSIATKRNLYVVAGVIDPQYTGEIKVALFNGQNGLPGWTTPIRRGDKIAQMILIESIPSFIELGKIDINTDRSDRGFGSSGQ